MANPVSTYPGGEAKFIITHLPCNTNVPCNELATLKIISFNTEGFTAAKSELISELCASENSNLLCLQETHCDSSQTHPEINGMTLINELPHAQHGSAIFARPNLHIISSNKEICGKTEMLTVKLNNVMITSIYKPPNKPFTCCTQWSNLKIFLIVQNKKGHLFKMALVMCGQHSTL